MQNGVAAHAVVERPIGVFFEAREHGFLLWPVQGVYDFIGVADKTVDVVDGLTQGGSQKADAQRKARAVRFGRALGAFRGNVVVEFQCVHDEGLTLEGGFMFNGQVHRRGFLRHDAQTVQVTPGFTGSHLS